MNAINAKVMSLPPARNKIYWLKLAIIALWASATPALLRAQHGGAMESKGGANSAEQAVKQRELAASVHKDLNCSSCHRETEMGSGKVNPVTSCTSCHKQAMEAYGASVHADAFIRRMPQAASCVSCHGSHAVHAVSNPLSPVAGLRVSNETCARCHESPQWTETHSIPPNVVADFRRSFHGLSAALGDRRMANCASCHSDHEILASSDPRSSVNEKNLGQTCGACHTGATAGFARGGVHYNPAVTGFKIVDFAGVIYRMVIALTLGFMLLHNGIDFWGRLDGLIARRVKTAKEITTRERDSIQPLPAESNVAAHPEATISAESKSTKPLKYLRFSVGERIQHWALAASFITLALTGFALKYTWQIPFLEAQQGALLRAFLHRAAAVVFILLAVYHVGYVALTRRGRLNLSALVPRIRSVRDLVFRCATCLFRLGPPSRADWRNLIQTVKYNLGLVPNPPAMGRFTYAEKMEYLGLIWGAGVMIVTGLVLWFEVPFLNRFPYWAIELATTVHFYEAVLATLSIIVWHFYYTIYNPLVFPLSKTMITGELSREEMERDHALELQTPEDQAKKEEHSHEN